MHVTDATDADDGELTYPFPDGDFVAVSGACLCVVPDGEETAHVFRPAGGDSVRYTTALSDRGTGTNYDVFRTRWKQDVADAVESAGYSIENAE
jgi:hypothetical protein